MGNQIEADCVKKYGECTRWGALHGQYDYKDDRFKNCSHCTQYVVDSYRRFVEERGKTEV